MTHTPSTTPAAGRAAALVRARWAAIGAAVAVSAGAGGIGLVSAAVDSGDRSIFQAIEPCRLADTREAPFNVGDRSTPLGAKETLTLSGWGDVGKCSLPTGTTGLSLNVTATDATAPTYLQIMPTGGTPGASSNLNPMPGTPATPNAVTTLLADDGTFSVYNLAGTVNVIVDVVGVYADHTHDDRYYTEAEVDALAPRGAIGPAATAIPMTASLPVGAPRVIETPAPGMAEVEVELTVTAPSGVVTCALILNGEEAATSPAVGNGGSVSFHEYVTVTDSVDAVTSVVLCTAAGGNPAHQAIVTGFHDATYFPTVG